MRLIPLITFILLINVSVHSQTILMEETVEDNDDPGNNGPNLKNFSHFYIGLGSMISIKDDTAEILYPGSFYGELGYRYKRKLFEQLAIGLDLAYSQKIYQLAQNKSKILPNAILHKKEKLIFYKFNLNIYTRVNYTKRGNYLGNFVDLGAGGNWTFAMRQITKDESNDIFSKTRTRGFDYYQPFNYHVFARLGFNRFVISGSYRLSNIFKNKYNYPELARLMVGLEVGFFS